MSRVEVHVVVWGETMSFTMAGADTTVLEGAREAGVDLPFMGEAGSCSTCRARLTEGRVEMRNNMALDDGEVAAGFVLACQAEPRSAEIRLDFDQEP